MKDSYGFPILKINKLNQVKYGNIHYVYKSFDFLVKKKPGVKNIAVCFHGASPSNKVVFRGYNYGGSKYDVLSIHDRILKSYGGKYLDGKLIMGWYLNSEKYPNMINTYSEIIKTITKDYNNVIFHGASAGGYPALYYASLTNQHCIIGNSQIYLDKYEYHEKTKDFMIKKSDKLIPYTNIHDQFKKHGYPKSIVLYCNILDTHHYQEHAVPFVNKCKEDGFIVDFIHFSKEPTKEKNAHCVNLPSGNYGMVCAQYFEKLDKKSNK